MQQSILRDLLPAKDAAIIIAVYSHLVELSTLHSNAELTPHVASVVNHITIGMRIGLRLGLQDRELANAILDALNRFVMIACTGLADDQLLLRTEADIADQIGAIAVDALQEDEQWKLQYPSF